jgi:nucleotidyltransferase substrate binding protein (TIGR01987 family)
VYISTTHLERALQTLHASLDALKQADVESIDFEIYRNAVIKGFELTLEVCGKLLRKSLKAYGGSPKEIDSLSYREIFRRAAKHGLVTVDLVERWYQYRDNRNNTAHDYGIAFAEETLTLLPAFMADVQAIIASLKEHFGDNNEA